MLEFLSDPIVLAAVGTLIGALGGYFLAKNKFKGIDTDTAAGVVVSVLRAIEGQTAEGTTLDTLLDALIPEFDKRFNGKVTDEIVNKTADIIQAGN